MSPSARRLSWIAGGAVIAFSAAIFVLASSSRSLDPPDLVSRPLASALLLAAPGLLGWIGAATARSSVLVAAGVACLFQSVIAFSGVTLIYLVPAIMFLQAGTAGSGPRIGEPIRPVRVVVAAVVSVPIALVILFNVGFLGIIGLVLVAGVAGALRSGRSRPTLTSLEAMRGLAIVLLLIGAWAATLALTETTCWVAHGEVGGNLVWERIPPTDTLTFENGEVASSCASGTITPTGVALAAGLLAAALGIAAVPSQRPRPATA